MERNGMISERELEVLGRRRKDLIGNTENLSAQEMDELIDINRILAEDYQKKEGTTVARYHPLRNVVLAKNETRENIQDCLDAGQSVSVPAEPVKKAIFINQSQFPKQEE